jgi:hypothetical protein
VSVYEWTFSVNGSYTTVEASTYHVALSRIGQLLKKSGMSIYSYINLIERKKAGGNDEAE